MDENSQKYLHGSCLCGAIQFQVRNIGERMGHCHCSMCRKFHGAAFATYGESKQSDFQWIKGESYLKSYRADNGTTRQFCKTCGSSLTFASDNYDENVVEFSMAVLWMMRLLSNLTLIFILTTKPRGIPSKMIYLNIKKEELLKESLNCKILLSLLWH